MKRGRLMHQRLRAEATSITDEKVAAEERIDPPAET